ncbi:MAG: carbohydrate ABC transporter permease, partial [Spirochaetaceae bacterium]|nr:carbohydrate ABC transporter permease [Spirochaetaceae bacterium]
MNKKLPKILRAVIMSLILLFLLFPIYWMIITSFKTNMEAYLYPPSMFPIHPVWDGFINLITENNEFFVYYFNNFFVSFASAFITCAVAIFAGYSIARFRTKWI